MAEQCVEHGRLCCGAKTRRGRCHAAPVPGTARCRTHAGKTLDRARADGLVAAVGLAAADWRPGGGHVDPGEQLLDLVAQSRRRADFLAELLAAAYAGDAVRFGETLRGSGVAALIGHRFALAKDGRPVAVEEAVRGLAQLESQERDRLGRLAEAAVRAGLVEAQANALNLLSGQLQAILDSVLTALGHDLGDPAVIRVVSEQLALAAAAGPAVVGGGDDDGL